MSTREAAMSRKTRPVNCPVLGRYPQQPRRPIRYSPGPVGGHLRTDFAGDLVDQGSAYACPMHAYARPPRKATSTCQSAQHRSSPATSRCAHPAYACLCSLDKVPRKSPEKPVDNAELPTRTRWSQRFASAKGRAAPEELVAGGCPRRATSDLRAAEHAGRRACIGQCICSCLLNGAPSRSTVPRNST